MLILLRGSAVLMPSLRDYIEKSADRTKVERQVKKTQQKQQRLLQQSGKAGRAGENKLLQPATNGDRRAMVDQHVYTFTEAGGLYVSKEDLVQPFIFPNGEYNELNARWLRTFPGRVMLLPEVITEEEKEAFIHHGDLAINKMKNNPEICFNGTGDLSYDVTCLSL